MESVLFVYTWNQEGVTMLGLIGAIISLVGWFGFQSILFLVIGTIFYAIETILKWNDLNRNAKKIDVLIIIAGCLIGPSISSVPWYACGLLAINFYSALIHIGSALFLIFAGLFLK